MKTKVGIKIVNKSGNKLPEYGTVQSAGMDLRANLNGVKVIQPFGRLLVPTGLYIELPVGFEAQICPRSGLALKKGLTVLNAPGVIDADYRGEIGVILINLSNEPQMIEKGERICQMVINKHETALLIEVEELEELNETDRGASGFGSTGNK